ILFSSFRKLLYIDSLFSFTLLLFVKNPTAFLCFSLFFSAFLCVKKKLNTYTKILFSSFRKLLYIDSLFSLTLLLFVKYYRQSRSNGMLSPLLPITPHLAPSLWGMSGQW
ncbi:MAG: hypothetical protein M0P99_00590, partial [Candidatus Cloacimonetes bacterium]|nr:hypothetical protein [Candidatus Cloacimonadota bacterium]